MKLGRRRLDVLVGIGATGEREARFWLCAGQPGHFELTIRGEGEEEHRGHFEVGELAEHDFTTSVCYPKNFAGGRPLAPNRRYRYAVKRLRDGLFIGEGRFETSPGSEEDAPDELSFAVMSCHQPFRKKDGRVQRKSLRMLRAAPRAFEEHNVKRVLMLGDQMYSDAPDGFSLFDPEYFREVGPPGRASILECSRAEVRSLYHDRYRTFWAIPEFQILQQQWPCYMILDDHDIVDNFGTHPEHGSPEWKELREGALDAYADFQGIRVHGRKEHRPPSFGFELEYGPAALFALDLRSRRGHSDGRYQIYDEGQHRDLERFLEQNRRRPVILLALSVPLVHVPEWLPKLAKRLLSEGNDVEDRWSTPRARWQQTRLAQLLRGHQRRNPEQRVIMVAGDIHVGLANQLCFDDSCDPTCYQLVSSAVSNIEQPIIQKGAAIVGRLRHHVRGGRSSTGGSLDLLNSIDASRHENPFDGLNIGIVKLSRKSGGWRVTLLLISHDKSDPPRPRVVFESEPI